jgi:HK97 family phage portal protein
MPSLYQRAKNSAVRLLVKTISNSEQMRQILVGGNGSGFTSHQYRPLAQAGFRDNDIVYFIIGDIARSVASIDLLMDDLPPDVVRLLKRPQQGKPWKIWVFEQMVHRLIVGESYSQIIKIGERIHELPIIRPDRIHPLNGELLPTGHVLHSWQLTNGGSLPPEEVFFSKLYDPLRDNDGWGPLQAARQNVDNRNSISKHNKDTLDNHGAPFGIMKVKEPKDGMPISYDQGQLDDVGEKINSKMAAGEGKTIVIDWNLEFERLGQTGREMDFSKTDEAAARKTAITFGFPPELLGLANGATFSNRAEAKEFLILNTVLPHLELILCDLSLTLGLPEVIEPDVEGIPALANVIRMRRNAAREDYKAGIISVEEAREEGGYSEEVDGTLLVDPRFIPVE